MANTVDTVVQDFEDIARGVGELAKLIADCKASGPGQVTQAQLDDLHSRAQVITAAIAAAK